MTTPTAPTSATELDDFTKHYLIAALWSSHDDENDGIPLDQDYDLSDIALSTLQEAWRDCLKFQMEQRAELAAAYEQYDELGLSSHPDAGSAQACAGHDFWLTRNCHGAGFWDRGLDNGQALTDAAHAYGEVHLYVQDSRVYMERG